jgi:transcriptional regulator with XRE-family HTH domain
MIMKSFEALIQTEEYWLEEIQNEIFRNVHAYMESENLNQSQLAARLGVSKGYISQILNGHFNFSLKKLIQLSLALGLAPQLQFVPISEIARNKSSDYEGTSQIRKASEPESKY